MKIVQITERLQVITIDYTRLQKITGIEYVCKHKDHMKNREDNRKITKITIRLHVITVDYRHYKRLQRSRCRFLI